MWGGSENSPVDCFPDVRMHLAFACSLLNGFTILGIPGKSVNGTGNPAHQAICVSKPEQLIVLRSTDDTIFL